MPKPAFALAALLLVSPLAASAKTDPVAWLKRIQTELDAINRKQKWLPEGEARPGSLASGAEARLDYAFAAGTAYRLVVVCEPDCVAGEAELLDPAGARVGEPGVLQNMPALTVTPAAAGAYVLRVGMTECAAAECAWSARLYARR